MATLDLHDVLWLVTYAGETKVYTSEAAAQQAALWFGPSATVKPALFVR